MTQSRGLSVRRAIAFLCVSLAALASTPARAIDKALLDKLAAHAAKVDKALRDGSFTVLVVSDELDSDGKPKKHSESKRQVSTTKEGDRHAEVLSASEDGKDTTAEERKKQAEREAKRKASKEAPKSNVSLPFEPEQAGKLFFWTVGTDAKTGLVRLGFWPKGARSDEVLEGEAVIDPVRGETVSVRMKPSKMPTFVDRMDLELGFDAVTDGVRLLSTLKVAGEGGIAFVKRRGSAVTTFSDYALPAAASAAPAGSSAAPAGGR